jgi:hypothetical protein
VFVILALSWPVAGAACEQTAEIGLAAKLRKLNARVFPVNGKTANALPSMLTRDVLTRIQAAAVRENTAWHEAKTRADLERLRDARIQALRDSLGPFPPARPGLKVHLWGGRHALQWRAIAAGPWRRLLSPFPAQWSASRLILNGRP